MSFYQSQVEKLHAGLVEPALLNSYRINQEHGLLFFHGVLGGLTFSNASYGEFFSK